MHARSVAGFIVVFVLMNVVVKRPFVAGLVHQMTDFILLALPEPFNMAFVAMLAPILGHDPSVLIDRRGKPVAMLATAIGELLIPSKL